MKIGLIAAALVCAVSPAFAQSAVPVSPTACAVTTVATGGTAVTAFAGKANGFMLMNTATPALFYSLTGTAATTASGGTFTLATGQWLYFPTSLANSVSLSVNAAATQSFSCMRW